ncbi:MAG: GH92 family glycosyl hydrolase [Niabella sp.]|nr:GH92 family glycosyl hydrolase [Niabella sp.]
MWQKITVYKICIFILVSFPGVTTAQQYLSYVQPLSGTASFEGTQQHKHSAGTENYANTIPAVTLPFAMTQWTPQTRLTENKCVPPYFYRDTLLTGFRGTHWMSGSCTQDYGSFTIMPVIGALKTNPKSHAIPFSHKNETTAPDYYQLTAGNVTTEMTSTLRCGYLQFTMLQDDSLYILVTPNSDFGQGYVEVDTAKGIIWGYNPVHRIYQGWGQPAGFNGWFYLKISRKPGSSGSFSGNELFTKSSVANRKNGGVFIGFKLKRGAQISIQAGTSFASKEEALQNLQTEIGTNSFATIRNSAREKWEQALGQIKVATNNERSKRIFYTAVYHAMQLPRLFSDADGSYPRFAGNSSTEKMTAGDYYDDFSMWDIYRAQLPLLTILKPELTNAFARSLILKGQQGGWLPIFPAWNHYTAAMIGDHATAFIASVYNKGLRGFDVEAAYALMRKNAFEIPEESVYKNGQGRRALISYLQYGFVPMEDSVPDAFHKKEQVSRTLEYAYDDYALATVAQQLGKTADYRQLQRRAFNYQKVFDPAVKMVRGRYADGRWVQRFHADQRETYITEGTPRQYTFYVPQDVPGLARQMGGTAALEKALDSLFIKDEYWHGNEPGHQVPFLYNYTQAPWKTQKAVREILRAEYTDGPGGLSGNDDAGQMSAWYVFAAIGFYPVDPVSQNYLLCNPAFDNVDIQLPNGKSFSIRCHKTTPDALYVEKVKWMGKPYNKNYITHGMLTRGGQLEMWLTKQPTKWGAAPEDHPAGLSK